MNLQLNGKKAIVTGGTRGIGLAIIETLLAEGADVAFCARNSKEVTATQQKLAQQNKKVIGSAIDISNKDQFQTWITNMGEQLNGIDSLILNAGAMVDESNEENWAKNFSVDLMGSVRAVEAARPFLIKAAATHGDASIIFLASISGLEAHGESAYGPIKAALIHFAKGIARQEAQHKIRANVVSPGPIYFADGYWGRVKESDPNAYQQLVSRGPLGRLGTTKEVAAGVVFLASPISSFTVGSNFVIDGAFTTRVG